MNYESPERMIRTGNRILEQMAFDASRDGMDLERMVLLMVDIADPAWDSLVRQIGAIVYNDPEISPDEFEGKNIKAVLQGEGFVEQIARECPEISGEILGAPPQGKVRALALCCGGAQVFYVEPKMHPENN